jgi:hypothetical protein
LRSWRRRIVCAWIARPAWHRRILVDRGHKFAFARFFALRREIARARPDVFHANLAPRRLPVRRARSHDTPASTSSSSSIRRYAPPPGRC